MTRLPVVLLLAFSAGCREQPTGPEDALPGAPLLSAERVRALPPGERPPWEAYLATSARAAAADRARVTQEAGGDAWTPAPAGPDFALTAAMTSGWFAGAEARQLADHLVSWQTPSGGWSKAVDCGGRVRRPGESYGSQSSWSWIATFDNGATTEQLRFLAAVSDAQADASHAAAFRRGLDYIAAAQFPNGCWPQIYPLEGSYHDAVTFNDDVAVRVLGLLATAAAGSYRFLTAGERQRAGDLLARGLECVAAAQVSVQGIPTGWAQQHDPLTLEPVGGRAYEPAALASLESAHVADLLMQLGTPGTRLVAAVHAAAVWLRQRAISGYAWENGELLQRAGAGPLWARLYQPGSNRPVFGDRDGSIHYDVRELSAERRAGYAWYVGAPAATLARYDAWTALHPY